MLAIRKMVVPPFAQTKLSVGTRFILDRLLERKDFGQHSCLLQSLVNKIFAEQLVFFEFDNLAVVTRNFLQRRLKLCFKFSVLKTQTSERHQTAKLMLLLSHSPSSLFVLG
ncbi:MAG: hypothetical protein RLZZ480_157 [Candidatus Parcubacteria bacterium]